MPHFRPVLPELYPEIGFTLTFIAVLQVKPASAVVIVRALLFSMAGCVFAMVFFEFSDIFWQRAVVECIVVSLWRGRVSMARSCSFDEAARAF